MRKKFFAFSSFVIFLFVLLHCVPVRAQESTGEVYDGEYDLIMLNGEITQVIDEGTIIMSATYAEGERIAKSGYLDCSFVYRNGFLVQENRGELCISYDTGYIEEIDATNYIGFTLKNERYTYIWDNDARISGIKNKDDVQIVKYIYSGLQVIDIQQLENGVWVSAQDVNFVGISNKIRSYGAYYDDETGWYYSNGIYNDVEHSRVVGLVEDEKWLTDKNPYCNDTDEAGIMLLGYEADDLAAEQWADELLANSAYNSAKESDWYQNSSASTVEIIARMIYGENTSNITDQKAIAWVVLNRLHSSRYSNNIREIVANKTEFGGVNSSNGRKAQSANDNGWRYATYYACLMLTNSSESCWNTIAAKPLGISNQLFFRSASSLGKSSSVVNAP